MTALVVLMNNKAAAVAADRAVTIQDMRGNRRVRDGVRKLFELPGRPGVALMIYNNAEIMGNAWEPIIRRFAAEIEGKAFASARDYGAAFFAFLESQRELFPEKLQRQHFVDHLQLFYAVTRLECDEILHRAHAEGHGPRTPREALAVAAGRVYDELTLDEQDNPRATLPGFDPAFGRSMLRAYEEEVNQLLQAYFGELTPDNHTLEKLREIAFLSVIADFFPPGLPFTGLVFVGYGAGEIHPELAAFEVQGLFHGKLRQRLSVVRQISSEDPVVVQPFAQDRMLRTLLYGLDPALPEYLLGELAAMLEGTRENLVASVPSLSAQAKRDVAEFLDDDYIYDMWFIFLERLRDFVYDTYTEPIFSSVSALPKAHLAEAAENMVRITAFQQDVSGETPTVGGGVDVALVSMDGFEWVVQAT